VTHPERGVALLDKLAGELGEIAVIEQSPLQDGRNMTMMLAPSKAVLAQESHEHEHNGEAAPAKSSRRDRAAAAHASENGSFVRPEPDPEEDTDDEMEPETAEE
jgi:translation initiation factor IF-3